LADKEEILYTVRMECTVSWQRYTIERSKVVWHLLVKNNTIWYTFTIRLTF